MGTQEAVNPAALTNLAQDLADAIATFNDADKAASQAQNRRTAALNNLNERQKLVDEFMKKLKDGSPFPSDWRQHQVRCVSEGV